MKALTAARDNLLRHVVAYLSSDARFVAGWLGGSFGRGEADEFSDLDLHVTVADDHAADICAADTPTSAGITTARRAIITLFGEPVIVHEHHANAPGNGSFTAVIYSSGLALDWTFLPHSEASREAATSLLFEHQAVPVDQPQIDIDQRELTERLAERYAFCWLLAVPASKALRRRDAVRFHAVLELMHRARRDMQLLLQHRITGYTRRSLAPFCPTEHEQREALREICRALLDDSERIRQAGAVIPEGPERVLDAWFDL